MEHVQELDSENKNGFFTPEHSFQNILHNQCQDQYLFFKQQAAIPYFCRYQTISPFWQTRLPQKMIAATIQVKVF